ncbi:M28 family peptidase [Micromonospora sp. FIMYZ51]|uniref:M28 family peptidase n=1 Tax=Micromonospora sp. FIMYZ51 TaxID=3051832 RepID=UPI00311E0BAA
MGPDPIVNHYLAEVAVDETLSCVERLAGLDRYQASTGLTRAADVVADAADRAGLTEVQIRQYPADGAAHWWSFRAPVSWTPREALLRLSGPGGAAVELDHHRSPFAVATYSSATPAGGTTAPLVELHGATPLGGALVVVDRPDYLDGSLLPRLVAAGAIGFVTDGPARDDGGTTWRGRIELPPDTSLLAFSLTPPEFRVAAELARAGGQATVRIVVDRTARMPVVSGLLPGMDPQADEIWVTAHLCHPRPSANDNASGVAAALGAAAAIGRAGRSGRPDRPARGIRWFWGPEFLGVAAVLHEHRDGRLPAAVLNLDMVGEDQARCGSPFVVERPPDLRPSLVPALAEHVVDAVFAGTSTGTGDTWTAVEFDGFSDHALFADPSIQRPAVQFCHPADRFNHSAADTPDKVSPLEMRRSTAAAAAFVHLAAGPGEPGSARPGAVRRWCAAQQEAAARIAARHGDPWGYGLRDHVARYTAGVGALLYGAPVAAPDRRDLGGLTAAWEGPLNLRAMQQALPGGTRAAVAGAIATDKSWLSVLFNLAIRADGSTDRHGLVATTSYALRRPLAGPVVDLLVDALLESGWVTEGATQCPSPTTRTAG